MKEKANTSKCEDCESLTTLAKDPIFGGEQLDHAPRKSLEDTATPLEA